MGSHVFISYSRTDRAYADKLAVHLQIAGFEVWYDYELATGDRFDRIIKEKIDTCAAFVVVMTPEADESHWVHVEVTHALNRKKAILPLLLRGEVFLVLNTIEFEDVAGERVPSQRFTATLRRLVKPGGTAPRTASMTDGLKVIPCYLVLDVSGTFGEITPEAIIAGVAVSIESNPLLHDMVRVGIIDFADDARVVRELSAVYEWRDLPRLRFRPGQRRYGPALRLLADVMHADLHALRRDGTTVYRSFALIFAYGDAADDWRRDLARLTDNDRGPWRTSRWYPILIPVAIGASASVGSVQLAHPPRLSRALTLGRGGVHETIRIAGEIVANSMDDILVDDGRSVLDSGSLVLPTEVGGFTNLDGDFV